MAERRMKPVKLEKALTFLEPGPLLLVTTFDGKKNNVMTISWSMPLDFDGRFALCTGPWNYSFAALRKRKECVLCVPGANLAKTAVQIGMVSGADTDKLARFGLKTRPAACVQAPLLEDCVACVECRAERFLPAYGLFILQAVKVWENPSCPDPRLVHAVGDGTFYADGEKFNFRRLMRAKLPPGL